MDIVYDWRSFQSVFHPRRKIQPISKVEPSGPVYVVAEQGVIVSAFAEGEDFSEWVGGSAKDLAAELSNREIIAVERERVDKLIADSLGRQHFYDQTEFLKSEVSSHLTSSKSGSRLLGKRHFLLEAIHGWWGKVMPSAFGVFIHLEGQNSRDLFVLVRRGRIESFYSPDAEGPPVQVMRNLSEKHSVPVQGIFASDQEWAEWSDALDPWREVALSIRAERTKLVPFRWTLATLVATRAFLGV